MKVKVFKFNDKNKIEFSQQELENLLNEIYNEGYSNGYSAYHPYSYTWTTPNPWSPLTSSATKDYPVSYTNSDNTKTLNVGSTSNGTITLASAIKKD